MKKIEAIIHPSKVSDVKRALLDMGVTRMTATEVKGFGRREGHIEVYRGTECFVDFLENIKVEVVISDRLTDEVVEAISRSSKDVKNGDAEILVFTLDQNPSVRTIGVGLAA